MALGPYIPIYAWVIEDLMREKQEDQYLLLFLAIARHADPLGFCFPGKARLMKMRHSGEARHDVRFAWLIDHEYITLGDLYDVFSRRMKPYIQVSPFKLYVRPEFQDYCEKTFSGDERDMSTEQILLRGVSLSSTKDSQAESLSSESKQRKQPASVTSPIKQKNTSAKNGSSAKAGAGAGLREGQQRTAQKQQRQPTQDRKEESPVRESDEFHTLLSPDVDDERIAQEIKLGVGTRIEQAREVVATYPRAAIVHWLGVTARRRQRGALTKPGGFFFKMLRENTPYPVNKMPEWAQEQIAYQDQQNDQQSDDKEI